MPAIDYDRARGLLNELFADAETRWGVKQPPFVSADAQQAADILFSSKTQSYREVLLGCCLARILDGSINIRSPYMNQGDDAFNGRTLDERVVNPFFQDRMIPSSKGPYLASFRRSVRFVPETAGGLRDQSGYDALLTYVEELESADQSTARALTAYLLYRFIGLRDVSIIPLARISRLSLEQYRDLIGNLLQLQSGGLIPVLLATAMLRTIKACFNLEWDVEAQGINVADKASGVGGDIVVSENGNVLLVLEVTERPIQKSRVVSTFNTKIVRAGIEDYLFVYSASGPAEDAVASARQYFSQGHEINFVQIEEWIVHNLATIGARCRAIFTREVLGLFGNPSVPAAVKVGWNDTLASVVGA